MALLRWKVKDIVDVISGCCNNKYDCIIFIEGNRGSGKSTLGYMIATKCRQHELRFNPKYHMVYSRKETLRLLATKTRQVVLSDEMINVAYNRDFYEQDQKLLLKALNMYRDSCNVFIGCIPRFDDLDNQIKRLCKIRITVKKRGLALIQVPVRGIFTPDPWDTQNNIKKELKAPKAIAKFSTVKGILKFRDLNTPQRARYEKLKKLNRGRVFDKDLNLKELDPQQQIMDKIFNKVSSGDFTEQYLLDSADLVGKKYTNLRNRLNQMLKDSGKPTVNKLLKKIKQKEEDKSYEYSEDNL